ncbi:hypothetical protein ACFCY8_10530 [Streptomyces noursei]|uniref:hypothetical protein n=1 Tax=Streptomyces noursei TaxID=1971 RepID=UPI0035D7D589
MNPDENPWAARWSFSTPSGVTADTRRFTSMEALKSTICKAAERTFTGLAEDEHDEMDEPWSRFITAVEPKAEPESRQLGQWRYTVGWAEVEITYAHA